MFRQIRLANKKNQKLKKSKMSPYNPQKPKSKKEWSNELMLKTINVQKHQVNKQKN